MKRLKIVATALILGFATGLALGGCRARHLGPDTGDSYRAAVAAQRDSDADAPAAMDADDARATMAEHRGEGAGAKRGASGGAAPSVTTSTSVSGGGSWPGATGNIRLDAK